MFYFAKSSPGPRNGFLRPPLFLSAEKKFQNFSCCADTYTYHICRAWYNGSYTMATKPIKFLELHYTMTQFLINIYIHYGYQISSIFIGSPDTGYQLLYLHYQMWSINASANKESWIKSFLRNRRPSLTKGIV